MFIRHLLTALLMAGAMLMVACGSTSQTPATQTPPTLASESTPIRPQSEPSASPLVPDARPTLPPEWTNTPAPSPTPPEPTATRVPPTPVPTREVCGAFTIDYARSTQTFSVGEQPTVYWSAVDTAARYRVLIIDANGNELYFGYTVETSFAFPPELFSSRERYGWEVYPEDSLSQQMCFRIGGELFPN